MQCWQSALSCKIGHRSSKMDPCECVRISNQNIKSNCCPAGKDFATLKVFRLYAQGLYGDTWGHTDGSVLVTYGDQNKHTFDIWIWTHFRKNERQTYVQCLWWRYLLEQWFSWQLLICSAYRDGDGKLHVSSWYLFLLLQCAPSLGGDQCQEYIPNPLSHPLAKIYTRNGVFHGESGKLNQPVR